jgi:hypothetical protein
MTRTARVWIGVNLIAVGGVSALVDRAVETPTSLTGTALATLVVTMSMAPMMQYLFSARGVRPERWWALVGLMTVSAVALRAIEQRYVGTGIPVAVWAMVAVLVIAPLVAWRFRRL